MEEEVTGKKRKRKESQEPNKKQKTKTQFDIVFDQFKQKYKCSKNDQ